MRQIYLRFLQTSHNVKLSGPIVLDQYPPYLFTQLDKICNLYYYYVVSYRYIHINEYNLLVTKIININNYSTIEEMDGF